MDDRSNQFFELTPAKGEQAQKRPLKAPKVVPTQLALPTSSQSVSAFGTVPLTKDAMPPPPNVVEVIGGCIDTPLSELMSANADVVCVVCGKPLPEAQSNVKTVVIDGQRWMACKGCFMP